MLWTIPKSIFWHSPCESRLHYASENVCHPEFRKVLSELHILYNVSDTPIIIWKVESYSNNWLINLTRFCIMILSKIRLYTTACDRGQPFIKDVIIVFRIFYFDPFLPYHFDITFTQNKWYKIKWPVVDNPP